MNYKKDFPIFKRKINDYPLAYLDNAATSQIPQVVLDQIIEFETNHRANVHRGVHTLSEEATQIYEESRLVISQFINANKPSEVVFVRNATEAINTVSHAWGMNNLKQGDIILLSEGEHHSNLIPWQILAKQNNLKLDFIPVNDDGFIDIKAVNTDWHKVKLVCLTQISNVFGVVNDIESIRINIRKKATNGMPAIMLDASQSIPHIPLNVQKLGVDFVAFSGHKMYGPMGIGVLWINRSRFEELIPYNTGGGMIDEVSLTEASFGSMPELLEAGTPNVTGAYGLATATKYITDIGYENISKIENELTKYAFEVLSKFESVKIIGTNDITKKTGVISFIVEGISSHDIAVVLDSVGVAIRSGHHCVMPWHMKNHYSATARISIAFYNEKSDIDALYQGLSKAIELLKKDG